MRRRRDRDRMLKRAQPKWPLFWAVPEHCVDKPDLLHAELRDVLRYRHLPPGHEVNATVLQDFVPFQGGPRYDLVLRLDLIARRDTNVALAARLPPATPVLRPSHGGHQDRP
jgi:hypothetical protein